MNLNPSYTIKLLAINDKEDQVLLELLEDGKFVRTLVLSEGDAIHIDPKVIRAVA